jgi:hypothetical protein
MLPREIQTEHWPEQTRYDLPRRPIGHLRWIGLVPIGFAVLFAQMPVRSMISFAQRLAEGKGGAPELVFAAFLSLFVLAALIPFGLGLFILAGRARVVVRNNRMIVTEIAGPFRHSRKLRFEDVDRLELRSGLSREEAPPPQVSSLARFGVLTAQLKDGKQRVVLMGYPSDWLEPLAEELTGLMQLKGAPVAVRKIQEHALREEVPVEEKAGQPPGTNIILTRQVNGLRIEVPPRGFRGNSGSMLGSGLFWCLFMAIFTFLAKSAPWPAWLFLLVFWAVGLGMVFGAINLARRRFTIQVENDRARVEQKGPFGSKSWVWDKSEVAAVRADASGVKINNVPVLELQWHLVNGKKVGTLGGRSEAELQWIAAELRQTLNVPAKSPGEANRSGS